MLEEVLEYHERVEAIIARKKLLGTYKEPHRITWKTIGIMLLFMVGAVMIMHAMRSK